MLRERRDSEELIATSELEMMKKAKREVLKRKARIENPKGMVKRRTELETSVLLILY